MSELDASKTIIGNYIINKAIYQLQLEMDLINRLYAKSLSYLGRKDKRRLTSLYSELEIGFLCFRGIVETVSMVPNPRIAEKDRLPIPEDVAKAKLSINNLDTIVNTVSRFPDIDNEELSSIRSNRNKIVGTINALLNFIILAHTNR